MPKRVAEKTRKSTAAENCRRRSGVVTRSQSRQFQQRFDAVVRQVVDDLGDIERGRTVGRGRRQRSPSPIHPAASRNIVIDLTDDINQNTEPIFPANAQPRMIRNGPLPEPQFEPANNRHHDSVVILDDEDSDDDEDDVIMVENSADEPQDKKKKQEENHDSAGTSHSGPTSKLSLQCPICLDDFGMVKADNTRQICATSCGHLFCSNCIDNAIQQYRNCPACRTPLTKRAVRVIYM